MKMVRGKEPETPARTANLGYRYNLGTPAYWCRVDLKKRQQMSLPLPDHSLLPGFSVDALALITARYPLDVHTHGQDASYRNVTPFTNCNHITVENSAVSMCTVLRAHRHRHTFDSLPEDIAGVITMRNLLIIIIAALLLSTTAMAQEKESQGFSAGSLFYGGKAGFMKPDGKDNDSALNIAGVVGAPIQKNLFWEAELGFSIIDGEVGTEDWDLVSAAGYAVYRTPGKVGVKAKLGVAYWDDPNDNDLSLSAGVGAGIRLGRKGILDLEYTQIHSGADFISAGYMYNFK